MPSRHKKVLRDSMLTHTFFNQVGSGSCSCCHGQSHKHVSKSVNPGDSDHSKFIEVGPSDAASSSVMSSVWKEQYQNLTPEQKQRLHAAIDMHPAISEPQAVMRALKFAHKQMTDVPAMADQFQPMKTFDLGNLDEVAKTYDMRCKIYKDEEEREMADLAGRIGNLAVTASDPNLSSADRLAAELDMHILNIHSKLIVPLTSSIRQVQLFNFEKRFGFVEESYQALCNDDKKRRGEDVPVELPLSFRQKWNSPFKLAQSASKPPKKKEKKRLSGIEALVELQRNRKIAIDEFQELKKTISHAEKPIELPGLPASFTYADVPVPVDVPDHIQQCFFDAEFAFEEVLDLQDEVSKQLSHVRRTFVAWFSDSQEAWEFGKRRIHELPLFREYEYIRSSLHAMFYVASRQEVKIVKFYSSEGAPELPLAMNKAFRLNSLSLEEFEKDWEVRCLRLRNTFPSVDRMLAQTDNMLKETATQDHPKTEWWKWLVNNPQ